MPLSETIYALSSGGAPSAIGVVRVTGKKAKKTLILMAGKIPEPRRMEHLKIRDAETKEVLDVGLVVYFSKSSSVTGEEMAEFHVHGSRAVIEGMFLSFSKIEGLRPAEPGEFTKRALLNGKIGITEVEALADLIDSETEAQRRRAIQQMQGGLSKKYNFLRKKLISLRAEIEASLDFSDEEELSDVSYAGQKEKIFSLIRQINIEIKKGHQGKKLREGIKIALIGPPNVGKSSLINVLLKEKRAIVSSEAGTTRDVIEARLNLKGIPVTIFDTAGIRLARSDIEKEGIKRARAIAKKADIVVFISDVLENPPCFKEQDLLKNTKTINVINKIDLIKNKRKLGGIAISCKTKKGISSFVKALEFLATEITGVEEGLVGPNRMRHIVNLKETEKSLKTSLKELNNNNIEISAEFLRAASVSLGRIVGTIGVEDVLDQLFKGFCIGK